MQHTRAPPPCFPAGTSIPHKQFGALRFGCVIKSGPRLLYVSLSCHAMVARLGKGDIASVAEHAVHALYAGCVKSKPTKTLPWWALEYNFCSVVIGLVNVQCECGLIGFGFLRARFSPCGFH